MLLVVFVHKIDTDAHPDQPAGWRWAVHHTPTPREMGSALNAGWQASRYDALIVGEAAAVVGVRAARLVGVAASYETCELPYDPQPSAGLDSITVMG